MKIIDYIEFITRKGIGQENIDKLDKYLKSENYRNLSEKEKVAVFNNYLNRREGMSYIEVLNNPKVFVDLVNSIENPEDFKKLIEITSLMSEQFNKLIFIMLLDSLKSNLKNASYNYNDIKLKNTIKIIKITMEVIGISDVDKLQYIEENMDFLSEDELFLASVYSYFDLYKQNEMIKSLSNRLKNIEKRFQFLNSEINEKTKDRSLAKSVVRNSIDINFKPIIYKGLEPELLEKLSILAEIGIQPNELEDYLNNKDILMELSIEQIARLSLDECLNSKIKFITDNEKRLYVFKKALLRPNITAEMDDLILNIDKYTVFFKNTPIEELEKYTNIQKLIDIIIQDKSNRFNIDSLDKVENYSRIRTEQCISILSGNIKEISLLEEFMDADLLPQSVLSQKKEALYQLFFGLSSEQVENLVKKYGEDAFKPEMYSKSMSIEEVKTLEIIRTLRKLYQTEDVDKICEKLLNNQELIKKLKTEEIQINYISLETAMIELYNNRMNEALYNPTKSSPSREIIYEGQPSKITVNNIFTKLFKAKDKLLEKITKFKGKKGIKDGLFGATTTYYFPDDSANGRKVKVYEIDPKMPFYMLARVDGAYSYYEEPYDYSNNKFYDLSYHGNCKSLISNDLLALARCDENSGPIFGYISQQSKELLMMAPWDIISCEANRKIAPQKSTWDLSGTGLQFRLPKYLKNCTRHNHNEIVCDRLIFDESKKEFRVDKPQYVIYVKDFDENTVIEDGKWHALSKKYGVNPNITSDKRFETLREYSEKSGIPLEELIYDNKYRQSVKAAAQYNIPLVIMDRQKIIENEYNKMNKAFEDFVQENDPQRIAEIIPELITNFENNAVSMRYASEKQRCLMFGENERRALFKTIKEKISLSGEYKEKLEKIFEMAIISEEQKLTSIYGNFNLESFRRHSSLYQELDRIGAKRREEYTKKELPRMIKAISETNFYDGNKHHSIEHIQKTMIFANRIADDQLFTAEQKRILIAAVAFYDSGRGKDKDGNDVHGVASALKVQEYYKSHPNNPFGITEENLPIIQAAIELHEIDDRDKDKYKIEFQRITKKYGIKDTENSVGYFETNTIIQWMFSITETEFLKQISDILKDADALDRFRFAHRGRLKPEYLRTKESKKHIDFAKELNNKFAAKVLEDVYHATPEELRGHRIISSLSYFRQKKEKENYDYVEPHIDIDTLLREVYGFSDYEEKADESVIEQKKDQISFMRRRRDFAMYDDLNPMDVRTFVDQLSKLASKFREIDNEEVKR